MSEKDVLILALSSGEHLLTQVEASNDGSYLCSGVLQIMSDMDTSTGQMRMGLVPYLPFADPDAGIAIPMTMAAIAIPSADLKNHYAEKFGLIITPPEPKIFLG